MMVQIACYNPPHYVMRGSMLPRVLCVSTIIDTPRAGNIYKLIVFVYIYIVVGYEWIRNKESLRKDEHSDLPVAALQAG